MRAGLRQSALSVVKTTRKRWQRCSHEPCRRAPTADVSGRRPSSWRRRANRSSASTMPSRSAPRVPMSSLSPRSLVAFLLSPSSSSRTAHHAGIVCVFLHSAARAYGYTRMFFQQGNWPKARSWLERTLKLKGGEDMGDVWAVLYKLESEHGLQRFGAMELYKEASFHSFLVPKLPITKSASQCRQVGANGQALLSIPVDDGLKGNDATFSLPSFSSTGTPQAAYEVMQRCKAADPHHGELWPQIVKDPAHWQWTTEQVLVYCAALFRLDQRSPLDALNPPPPGVPVVPPPPPKEATGADGLSAAGGATALTEEKKPKAEPGVVMSAAAPSSLSSSSSAVVAAASTPPRSPSSTAAQPKQEGGVAMAPPPTMGPPAARRSG